MESANTKIGVCFTKQEVLRRIPHPNKKHELVHYYSLLASPVTWKHHAFRCIPLAHETNVTWFVIAR